MKETKKFKGIHWTKMPNKEDILERMRQKKIGKRMSDETKEKISDSQKRIGNKPPNWKGKKRSQHHKDSVSAYLTGRPRLDMRGPQNPLWKDGISKDIKTYAKNYELNKKEKLAGRKISEQCEICGIPASELSRRLSYDHNHVTGVFRGWLCGRCNTALGLVSDNTETLAKMIDYIKTDGFKTWNGIT